jgi:hypothetical protein
MKARLRKIGNSQRIIFPKEVIERCNLEEEVEITVLDDLAPFKMITGASGSFQEKTKTIHAYTRP